MDGPIKVIIFDIGGVITLRDANEYWNKLYFSFGEKIGVNGDEMIRFHRNNFAKMLTGEILFSDILNYFSKQNNLTFDFENVKKIWINEAIRIGGAEIINKDIILLIRSLREHYKILSLTNLTEGRMYIDQELGIYKYFDDVILSVREGLVKPNSEFFEVALSRVQASPDEVVFIDDQQRMIDKANQMGLHGICYKNVEQLKEELRALNILV